ncbi:hypothetical protein MYX82_13430 [Acidobacteria bacterium AH-259-D05]|nr:hypothetical protein [Acidobacteria bacterium AH-259-D05]
MPEEAPIEYLRTENQVLKDQLGKRRILLSDEQRRRLALHQGSVVDCLLKPRNQ